MINVDTGLPRHVGIIMDGNGRWANSRNLPRVEGHKEGLLTAKKIIDSSLKLGVECLSLYVFSTENWKRPKAEIDGLFALASEYADSYDEFARKNVKIVFSGDRNGLSKLLLTKLDHAVASTSANSGLTVNLCINYGGRREIVNAVNTVLASGTKVTEESLGRALYVNLPDVDLIIRTGGEKRLSNFLLYQCAYSELFFTDTLWPDFGEEEFKSILTEYGSRCRNFGGLTNVK